MTEQLAHSILGPSSAKRWINCPGSVLATKDLPDITSKFAAEGTAAHTVSEWCRVQGRKASEFIGTPIHVEGYDFVVDQEMADAVQEFVDKCAEFVGDPFYELRVAYEEYVPGGFGTDDDTRIRDFVAKITDLKFGKGVQVYAENNEQLMLYALGVYLRFGWLYVFDKFVLAISQPRLDHYDEVEVSLEDVLNFATNVAKPAAEIALKPGAPFKAGSWCQFCKIKASCRTRAEANFAEVTGEFSDLDEAVMATEKAVERIPTLSNDEIAKALLAVPHIIKWAESLKKYATKEMMEGRAVGDFKFVAGRGDRSWAASEDEVVSKLVEAGVPEEDLYSKPELLGPAKVEKLPAVGKKAFAPATTKKPAGPLADLIRKSKGKPTLVPGSDKREEISVDATSDFEDLTEGDEDE